MSSNTGDGNAKKAEKQILSDCDLASDYDEKVPTTNRFGLRRSIGLRRGKKSKRKSYAVEGAAVTDTVSRDSSATISNTCTVSRDSSATISNTCTVARDSSAQVSSANTCTNISNTCTATQDSSTNNAIESLEIEEATDAILWNEQQIVAEDSAYASRAIAQTSGIIVEKQTNSVKTTVNQSVSKNEPQVLEKPAKSEKMHEDADNCSHSSEVSQSSSIFGLRDKISVTFGKKRGKMLKKASSELSTESVDNLTKSTKEVFVEKKSNSAETNKFSEVIVEKLTHSEETYLTNEIAPTEENQVHATKEDDENGGNNSEMEPNSSKFGIRNKISGTFGRKNGKLVQKSLAQEPADTKNVLLLSRKSIDIELQPDSEDSQIPEIANVSKELKIVEFEKNDEERLQHFADITDHTMESKPEDSNSSSKTNTTTGITSRFGIRDKLKSLSQRRKKSEKKKKVNGTIPKTPTAAQSNETRDGSPQVVNEIVKKEEQQLESLWNDIYSDDEHEKPKEDLCKEDLADTSFGLRKKLEGAFSSIRQKDRDSKLKATVQRSNTETSATMPERIRSKIVSLPSSDEIPLPSNFQLNSSDIQKSIQPILDEFVATEVSYVNNLWNGINSYGQIFQRNDIPEELQGKKYELLGNIEEIAMFHRYQLLPLLEKNLDCAEKIFTELQQYVEENKFHSYVVYTINKQRSMQLCATHKSYFESLQKELEDRLGINSFLLQPIQRMARYPLLLTQCISTLFKQQNYESKTLMTALCRLETRLRNLLNTINESECINDIVRLDVSEMIRCFRKVGDFKVYDHVRKRNYQAKLFLFDTGLVYTKCVGKQLVFRRRYAGEFVKITLNDQGFSLCYNYDGRESTKCDFVAGAEQIKLWLKLLQEVLSLEEDKPKSEDVEYAPEDYNRIGDFEIFDHKLARKYRGKVFLMDECITYTEAIEGRNILRGSFPFDHMGVAPPSKESFTLVYDSREKEKCDFIAEAKMITEWWNLIYEQITLHYKRKVALRGKEGDETGSRSSKSSVEH